MFYDKYIEMCKQKNISPSKAAQEIGFNKSSITNWKNNGYTPRKEILLKIADYFHVSIDYLLGQDGNEQARPVSKDDIKFALFDGSDDITDEMYDEVKQFAAFVKNKYKKKDE